MSKERQPPPHPASSFATRPGGRAHRDVLDRVSRSSSRSSLRGDDPPPASTPIRRKKSRTPVPKENDDLRSRAGGLFPLAKADNSTYVSVCKADIYQVQIRLDRNRGTERSIATPRSSKRRSEIDAIKQSTLDVETIVKTTKEPEELKLRLLEHLSGVMGHLEVSVLGQTDRSSSRPFEGPSSRPTTPANSLAPPSLSRLPSWLAMIDRLMEFQNKLDEAISNPVSRNTLGVGTATSDSLDEMESQLMMLEAELGMEHKSDKSLLETHGSALHATLGRLKRAAVAVEIIRERGVRHLQQESDENLKTSRKIADTLERARMEFQEKLKGLQEVNTDLKAQAGDLATQVQSKVRKEDGALKEMEAMVKAMEVELKEAKQATTVMDKGRLKELEELKKKNTYLERQLDAAADKRGDDADYHYQELQALEHTHRVALEALEAKGGQQRGGDVDDGAASESSLVLTLASTHEAALSALQARLDASELEAVRASAELEAMKRTKTAEEEQTRTRKLSVALELSQGRGRELATAHALELRQAQASAREVAKQLTALKTLHSAELKAKEQQLSKTRALLPPESDPMQALRQVMMEETIAMKAAYDNKCLHLHDTLAASVKAARQREKSLSEQLKEAKANHQHALKQLMSV